jgi:hypothetical protein
VRRILSADPVVAIAFVPGVAISSGYAERSLAPRVLVVGSADAPGARFAHRLADSVAVHRGKAVPGAVVRTVGVGAVPGEVRVGCRLRCRRVAEGSACRPRRPDGERQQQRTGSEQQKPDPYPTPEPNLHRATSCMWRQTIGATVAGP